jgi:hypothetical protein
LFITENILKKTARLIAPSAVSNSIKSRIKTLAIKPNSIKIKDESIEVLIDFFRSDIQNLSYLLNKDLSFWMKPENIRRR